MWHQFRSWFEVDGALRDILVFDTLEADWDRLLGAVTEWGYDATWSVAGEPKAALESAGLAFSLPEHVILTIRVGSLSVNLHFFGVEEIEMDVDPREIQDESAFQELQEFMRRVGQVLQKPVYLALEGMHERPFLTFDPRRAAFTSPDG